MEPYESLKNELKLLDNFMSRRNQSGLQKSMMKILQNPIRDHFLFKVIATRPAILQELKRSLNDLVSAYQTDTISPDLVIRCIRLARSLNGYVQIGLLTPVCCLCHNPCDPYAKKVACCGYFAHIPCLEQITTPNNKFICPKCSQINTLEIEVQCQNCRKALLPDKTMVSACRHIVCADCVTAAQPLVPSPLCFCCPYRLPSHFNFRLEDVAVAL
jgi:hypothetical protein